MDSKGITIMKISKALPHELVMEILSRLPVQYLFRFSCVSKTWLQSITQDPHFAKLHFDRSLHSKKVNPSSNCSTLVEQSNSLVMALDYTGSDILIQFDLPFPPKKRYVLCGFCNGMLCYACKDYKHVYIWNPLTRDYITIPCPPMPPDRFPNHHYKSTKFGFGYDPGRNEYKVICVYREADLKNLFHYYTQVSVFTLGLNSSWRIVVDDLQYFLGFGSGDKKRVPSVNGVFYWLAHKLGVDSFDRIVGFDVRDEVFTDLLSLTDIDFNDTSGFYKIGEVHGLCSRLLEFFCTDVQVWQLRKRGDSRSWTKLLRVATPDESHVLFYLDAMQHAQNGKTELKLESDLDKRSITMMKQFVGLKFFHTHNYLASIISPGVISGAAHNLTEKRTRRSRKRKR